MTLVQKIIEAEKKRNKGDRAKVGRPDRPRAETIANTAGTFGEISSAAISSKVMERNNILPATDDRGAITAFKILRTRVLQRMRSNNWRSLIVTSAGAGEGKTLVSCNMAVSMSHDLNQSVILVDLDLQRPSMASYFGLEVDASIGDYLTGDAELRDVIYSPEGLDRIAIVPNRDPVPNSSELLASPQMRTLLNAFRDQGPDALTIFDMPPVLACDDVLAFSPSADAILMVVAEGKTERGSLSRTMEMLGDRELLGVVLNKSREGLPDEYYY